MMFIKIKLEPQNLKALSALKNISYFSIDDDATISDLKMKIEEFVDVPAEHQELRTLTKVFQNNWNVKDVCDVRGSAIMLYAYDEYYEYEDPQFVCFLQVYTNELAAQQQELEQRSKVVTPSSSTSSITLIADSDTEQDSVGTDSETDSCKLSDSDSEGSSSTDSSCGRKRSKHERRHTIVQNKKLKVTVPSSETLCQFLDEFPKSTSKEIAAPNRPLKETSTETSNKENFSKYSTLEILPPTTGETLKPALIDSSKEILSAENKKTIENNMENKENKDKPQDMTANNNQVLHETNSSNINKIQSNIITTTNNYSHKNNIHPCYSINPEIRDYLAIISSSDMNTTISSIECEEVLVWFFDRFRACDSSSQLQFDNKTAISLFEGKLWIACMNSATYQWICANITKYSLKSYKILTLKDSKHLCEVVVPVVSNSKTALDIFDLLEKQNKNISTLKWSLQSRRILLESDKDFKEKSISTFCTNEMFLIFMDTQSKECLEKLDCKLKYCFWQIVFKFS
ncbi:uncharacterized protein LOC111690203 [Lucilia cuprina]|uniref:uncharacterized protein LOC111690203 n=1 Tax=Lucilia cuprina TaxID=7375 RepID=UPI001F05BAAD|nr:uncharacterized protein LOC111690203 [Lucilia cuprina]